MVVQVRIEVRREERLIRTILAGDLAGDDVTLDQ